MGEIPLLLAGLALGLLSGMLPGLHSNTVISVLSSLGLDDRALAVIIISLFPAHLVTSFIPSIFFGIPEAGTVVAVLPGQRMVLMGKGLAALKAVLLSSIIAALLSLALFGISMDLFPIVYHAIKKEMGLVLLAVSLILLARSRRPHLALPVFLAAGMLGRFSLDSGMQDPFLPMFSGMFAIAAILNYSKRRIPRQEDIAIGNGFVRFTVLGVLLGFLADLIPGVGSPSQVATFLAIFMPMDTLGYMAAISSISMSQAVFSLATAASIGKARMGATAMLSESIGIQENLGFLLALFMASMAGAALLIFIMRGRIARLAGLDFSRINIVLALYLIAITFCIDGLVGLAVLTVGSGLGWLTLRLGVERITLMGAIILPTMLLLFGM